MSDTALGPHWWRAADGKWHPPELRPPGAGSGVDSTEEGEDRLDESEERPIDSATGVIDGEVTEDVVAAEALVPLVPTEEPPDVIVPQPPAVVEAPRPLASSMLIRPEPPRITPEPHVWEVDQPSHRMRVIPPFYMREAEEDEVDSAASAAIPQGSTGEPDPVATVEPEFPFEPEPVALVETVFDAEFAAVPEDVTFADEATTAPDFTDDDAPPPSLHSLVFQAEPETSSTRSVGTGDAEFDDDAPPPSLHSLVFQAEPETSGQPVPAAPLVDPSPQVEPESVFVTAPEPVVESVVEPVTVVAASAVVEVAPEPVAPVMEPTVVPTSAPKRTRRTAAAAKADDVPEAPAPSPNGTLAAERDSHGPGPSATQAAKNAELFKGGPEFPDIFKMAMKGSSLADKLEVKYDAGSARQSDTTSGGKAASEATDDKGRGRRKRKGR
jgi:hypothetical protein